MFFVKQLFTCSALVFIVLAAFSSCKKDYTCYCYIDYVNADTKTSVYHTDNTFSVRAVKKDDAKLSCHYYQEDGSYLNQHVYINHNCDIR